MTSKALLGSKGFWHIKKGLSEAKDTKLEAHQKASSKNRVENKILFYNLFFWWERKLLKKFGHFKTKSIKIRTGVSQDN